MRCADRHAEVKTTHIITYINIDITILKLVFIDVMGRKAVSLYPSTQRQLTDLGTRIQRARLRRSLSVELVAERAGISRASVWAVEKGSPSVAMGIYAQVLLSIGFDTDLAKIAADDALGQTLQDLKLPTRRRAPRRGRND